MSTPTLRALTLMLLVTPLLGSCAEVPPSFILRLRPSTGADNADHQVEAAAVDEIEVLIDPPANRMFEITPSMMLDGGDVRADVTSAGVWRLTLLEGWVRTHTRSDSGGAYFDVPLWTEDDMASEFGAPNVSVAFFSRTAGGARQEIARPTAAANLPWPLVGGELFPDSAGIIVRCIDGQRAACRDTE